MARAGLCLAMPDEDFSFSLNQITANLCSSHETPFLKGYEPKRAELEDEQRRVRSNKTNHQIER